MKLAICNETFVDWEWERVLEHVAARGYDGLEVAPFTLAPDCREIDAQKRRDLRRAAERSGVEIVGLHWLLVKPPGLYVTTPDDALRLRTADYFVELTRHIDNLSWVSTSDYVLVDDRTFVYDRTECEFSGIHTSFVADLYSVKQVGVRFGSVFFRRSARMSTASSHSIRVKPFMPG